MSSLLVGVDASLESAVAAREAWRLGQTMGLHVYLRHIMSEIWWDPEDPRPQVDRPINKERIADRREKVLEALRRTIPDQFEDHFEIDFGEPAPVLRALVDSLGSQLVVMGASPHAGLDRILHRSIPHEMLRISPVPVLFVAGELDIRRVLVAVDDSDMADRTARLATAFATGLGAQCRYLTVRQRDDGQPHPLEASGTELGPGGQAVLRFGEVIDTICEEVRVWPADLLVIGTHGKNFLTRATVGSVTEKLVWRLPTSTMVVPPPPLPPRDTDA